MREKFVESEELRAIELHQLKMTLMRNMADERISMERIEHNDRRREIIRCIEISESIAKKEIEFWNIKNATARGEIMPFRVTMSETVPKKN